MLQVDVSAQVRSTFGKGAARTLRRDGMVPAIMYGANLEATALALDTKTFTKALLGIQRRNAVITLDVAEGKKKTTRHVMIKEIQTDPVTDALRHADFCEVSLDEPMVLDIPVLYTGKAKGVELGGELVISKPTISLQGKVLDLPDNIEADVSDLALGDKLTCDDLGITGDVTLLDSNSAVCVAVCEASKKAEYDEGDEAAAEKTPAAEDAAAPEEK